MSFKTEANDPMPKTVEPANAAPSNDQKRLCVLKFGSSVLTCENDFPKLVQEIYRHVRDSEKVVAVISALAGETDALLCQSQRIAGETAPAALIARLARIGELKSAALLALALSRAGVRAAPLDPHEMGLFAQGEPLDADLSELDAEAVWACIDANDVVVVPGFIAGHQSHCVVTLGRGGTDLSAVFFADRLSAHRVRLIKDVDGVYEEDPAINPAALRYSHLTYAEAKRASNGLIQHKAIRAAEAKDVLIEIASLCSAEATTIARVTSSKTQPIRSERLKVALLGCGAVGAGVLELLQAHPDLFEVGPVLVRNPDAHLERAQFTSNLEDALAGNPDIVIELVGGLDIAWQALHRSVLQGSQVITANKAVVAKYWDALHSAAARHRGSLRFSATVGGGAPILETIARLKGSVISIEGVMNGTCNYLLSRLGEGWDLDRSIAKAQELGFAEADPRADVDSLDAANKLSIIVREAFGTALQPQWIARQSVRDLAPLAATEALKRGQILKQVGSCRLLADGSVEAEVRIASLPATHPLARTRDEENCFIVTDSSEKVHEVFGKGAGRWPTATAVFADVLDAQRQLLGKRVEAVVKRQKLRA
jgi:homoserine dehydrogenase